MVNLGLGVTDGWIQLQKKHGAIGLQKVSKGEVVVQIQISDNNRTSFDDIQVPVEHSTFVVDGRILYQEAKTLGKFQFVVVKDGD